MSMSANTLQLRRREQKVRAEGKLCNCNAAIFFYSPLPSLSAPLTHWMKCQQLHLSGGPTVSVARTQIFPMKIAAKHGKLAHENRFRNCARKVNSKKGRGEMKSGKAAWINCGRQRVTERSRETEGETQREREGERHKATGNCEEQWKSMWKYGKIVYGKPESRRKACRGRQETKVETQTETGRERERREGEQ